MSGLVFVITGPSGIGKTYLIERFIEESDRGVLAPPLHTTRKPRNTADTDRIHTPEDQFEELVESGVIHIAGEYEGAKYGWPKGVFFADSPTIANAWPQMLLNMLDAEHIPEFVPIILYPEGGNLEYVKARMFERSDDESTIHRRLNRAKNDIKHIEALKEHPTVQHHDTFFVIANQTDIHDVVLPKMHDLLANENTQHI